MIPWLVVWSLRSHPVSEGVTRLTMSSASDTFATLFWGLGGLAALIMLFAAPFLLFKFYRQKYGNKGFQVAWSEANEQAPFRSGEQEFGYELEVTNSAEWGAKLGFFLGILGFAWTPLVFIGIASGLMPMVTVGLPGLVVSWSVFFAARAYLKHGAGAVGLMRFAAITEVVVNIWVLVLVALVTEFQGRGVVPVPSDVLPYALLTTPNKMDMYEIPYSLQQGGTIPVVYALISFFHAGLLLRNLAPLARAKKLQTQTA